MNANPDLSPGAGLARMARAADLDYTDLVRRIAAHALANPRRGMADEMWELTQRLSGVS